MPNEYKCKQCADGSRRWSTNEIQWCKNMLIKGCSTSDIAESVSRTIGSVEAKLESLLKTNNLFNGNYEEKYYINQLFLEIIKPSSVLDLYCGTKQYYTNKAKRVITNDLNPNIPANYNLDSLKLLCKLFTENESFDLIDLDGFYNIGNCLDLAIQMANKGIIVSIGELGYNKYKYLEYANYFYDIKSLESFTSYNIIKYIKKIGLRYNKKLKDEYIKEWPNSTRIWFKIEFVNADK